MPEEKAFKKELLTFCRKIVPGKCTAPAQMKRQVDSLYKLIRTDQDTIDIERIYSADKWEKEVFAVLEWARADTEPVKKWDGWSKVFQSIPPLRDDNLDKYKKIRLSYLSDMKRKNKSGAPAKLDDPDKFGPTGKTKL